MLLKQYRRYYLLFLLAAAACHKPQPAVLYPTNGPQSIQADMYQDVLNTWTRSTKIYRMLEDKLFVKATFHAPAFRHAFAAAFPQIYGHGSEITKHELIDETPHYYTFLLCVYTPNKRWNDLAQADSIWHLHLKSSKSPEGVLATEIVPIKADANLQAVYPYITRFDKLYLVRFPIHDKNNQAVLEPGVSYFILSIASALGVAYMQWDIAES